MQGSELLKEVLYPFGKDKNLYIYPTSKYWRKIYIGDSDCAIYVSPSKSIERVDNMLCIAKKYGSTFCYTIEQFADLYRILCGD